MTYPMRMGPDGNDVAIRNREDPDGQWPWSTSDGALVPDSHVADWTPLGREINTPEVRQAIAAVITRVVDKDCGPIHSDEHDAARVNLAAVLSGVVFVVLDRASAGAPLDQA